VPPSDDAVGALFEDFIGTTTPSESSLSVHARLTALALLQPDCSVSVPSMMRAPGSPGFSFSASLVLRLRGIGNGLLALAPAAVWPSLWFPVFRLEMLHNHSVHGGRIPDSIYEAQ
jgi:hypothetical protein